MDETLSAFFELPIPMHQDLVPDLVNGLDKNLQHYIFKAKSSCGKLNLYLSQYALCFSFTLNSCLIPKKCLFQWNAQLNKA